MDQEPRLWSLEFRATMHTPHIRSLQSSQVTLLKSNPFFPFFFLAAAGDAASWLYSHLRSFCQDPGQNKMAEIQPFYSEARTEIPGAPGA